MKTDEVIKILEDNKITNVVKQEPKIIYKEKDFYDKAQEEKELLNMGLKDSIRQKEERTPSEKLQDDLEPIPSYPCPMHEDYDDEEDYKQNQGKDDVV